MQRGYKMNEDDLIADPNINLLNDPALALRFLTAISKSVGSQAEASKSLVSTMDDLSGAVKELVKAENQRQVDRAVDEARFKTIETTQHNMSTLMAKYFDKTDSLEKTMTESCDITTNSMKSYTDKTVGLLWNKIMLAVAIVVGLGGYIWSETKDDVDYHIRNDKIHHEKAE